MEYCQEHCLLCQKVSYFCENFYEKYLSYLSAKYCISRQLIYLYLLEPTECVTDFSFSHTMLEILALNLWQTSKTCVDHHSNGFSLIPHYSLLSFFIQTFFTYNMHIEKYT